MTLRSGLLFLLLGMMSTVHATERSETLSYISTAIIPGLGLVLNEEYVGGGVMATTHAVGIVWLVNSARHKNTTDLWGAITVLTILRVTDFGLTFKQLEHDRGMALGINIPL